MPAAVSRRIVAFVLDLVVVAAFFFTAARLTSGFRLWVATAIFFALYHTVSLSVLGSTLGKSVMALKVQAWDGERLAWKWALLRSTAGYLASGFFFLGFLHILVDDRRRGWHDLLSGSEVVQQPGALSLRRMIEAVDRWTELLDAWQKRAQARITRLRGLIQLLVKLTGTITLVTGGVEQALVFLATWWGKILHRLRPLFGRPREAPAAGAPPDASPAMATGTTHAATAPAAAGAGGLASVASTVTTLILAGSTIVIYQASAPPALRPWDEPPTAPLTGDCRGTITPSATRGRVGDFVDFVIAVTPPFENIIARVVTNNPGCRECPATNAGQGRFTWRGRLNEPGRARVEFVAYDQEGKVRCRGQSPEITILAPTR